MQAAVELVLGFEKSWVTKKNLAINQERFLAWTDAFTHAPMDLPGFSKKFFPAFEASSLQPDVFGPHFQSPACMLSPSCQPQVCLHIPGFDPSIHLYIHPPTHPPTHPPSQFIQLNYQFNVFLCPMCNAPVLPLCTTGRCMPAHTWYQHNIITLAQNDKPCQWDSLVSCVCLTRHLQTAEPPRKHKAASNDSPLSHALCC